MSLNLPLIDLAACRESLRARLGARIEAALKYLHEFPPRYPHPEILPEDSVRVLAAYGASCVFCTRANRLTVRFIVPPRREGTADRENLVPVCARCRARRAGRH